MTTVRKRSMAIAIEGVGSDTSKSKGIAWAYGQRPTSGQLASIDYEWVGGAKTGSGLADPIRTISTSVDPFTAEVTSGGYMASMHFDDTVALHLARHETYTTLYLDSAITSSDTTVVIQSDIILGDENGLDGTVIWIDDEAILLGTESGSTGSYSGCTRNYFSTYAQPHDAGVLAFTSNPYLNGRRYKLLLFDHAGSGTLTEIDRGLIEVKSTSPDGTKFNLGCKQLISAISGAEVNTSAVDLRRAWKGVCYEQEGFSKMQHASIALNLYGGRYGKRLAKTGDAVHSQYYQVSGGVARLNVTTSSGVDSTSFVNGEFVNLSGSAVEINVEDGSQHGDVEKNEPVHEIFYINRLADESGGTVASPSDAYSPTRDLAHPTSGAQLIFHPIAIPLALMTSSPATSPASGGNDFADVLGWQWGLGLPYEDIDSNVETVLEDTREMKVDQLLLGWDGQPINPWQVFKDLALLFGMMPSITTEGKLDVRRFRELTIGDLIEISSDSSRVLTAIPSTLSWTPSSVSAISQITGEVGGLPWLTADRITVNSITTADDRPGASIRSKLQSSRTNSTLDFHPFRSLNSARNRAISLVQLRYRPLPTLSIKVNGQSPQIGEVVQVSDIPVEDAWFPGSDGTRVAISSSSSIDFKTFGMIISRKYNIIEDNTEISMLMTGYTLNGISRYRAPSAKVVSVASNVITVEASEFGSADGADFSADMLVKVVNEDLSSVTSEIKTVTASTSTTITVDSSYSSPPQAGDYIELAYTGTAIITGYPLTGYSGLGTLEHTFMASSSSHTIGYLGDYEAHKYGT